MQYIDNKGLWSERGREWGWGVIIVRAIKLWNKNLLRIYIGYNNFRKQLENKLIELTHRQLVCFKFIGII